MKFLYRDVGDVTIVEYDKSRVPFLGSKLDREEVDQTFKHIRDIYATRKFHMLPRVLLNFYNVRDLTPAAMDRLEEQARLTKEASGEVRVLNIDRIRNVRTLARLASILPVHNDEVEAVRAFV